MTLINCQCNCEQFHCSECYGSDCKPFWRGVKDYCRTFWIVIGNFVLYFLVFLFYILFLSFWNWVLDFEPYFQETMEYYWKTHLSLVFPPMWLCLGHGKCTNWIWSPTKIVDEVCDEVWGKEDDMDWKKDFKSYLHNKYKKIFWLYCIKYLYSTFDELIQYEVWVILHRLTHLNSRYKKSLNPEKPKTIPNYLSMTNC